MKKSWQLVCTITLLTATLLLLEGCGQMGPLYHPDEPADPFTHSP